MIRILLVLLLLAPASAMAQGFTPVSKETANKYYANCMAQQSPQQKLSQQSQQIMCACTAARMTQFFTMEDMKAMMDNNPAIARPAYNKMLVEVYAPCMESPTREYYHMVCLNNPDTARYGDPQKICTCLGNAMGMHLQYNGPEVFRELLSRNPNLMDPMTALTNDPAFETFAQTKLVECLK